MVTSSTIAISGRNQRDSRSDRFGRFSSTKLANMSRFLLLQTAPA